MSYAPAWARDAIEQHHLPHGPGLLLHTLVSYANRGGDGWPSIETLAKKLSVHKRTLSRYLDRLHHEGLVSTRRQG